MIKIGDFSQLSRVPVKTLRYYDEIGLLKPAIVDRFTSYRYYTLDQLPRLNRILAFKEFGLSLEQIAALLNENLSLEQIRGMLRLKQAEVQQHIHTEQERLTRIEARIRRIEQEGQMPTQEATVRQVAQQKVISYREVVPDVPAISNLIMKVADAGYGSGLQSTGNMMAIYHHKEVQTSDWDTEVAIPVADDYEGDIQIDEQRKMTTRVIPAYDAVASLIHHGNYYNIEETYMALTKWILESGYNILVPAVEIYLRTAGETNNPEEYLTEVQFVVEKVAQPVR